MRIKDSELIAAIKAGRDDKVLSELYDHILPKVISFIRSNSGSDDEAFDVFQDAVLAFFKQVVTGKFDEKYDVSGFIYSVSRNLWINRVKKINRHISVETEATQELEEESFLESVYSEEKTNLVKSLFQKLDSKLRSAFCVTQMC